MACREGILPTLVFSQWDSEQDLILCINDGRCVVRTYFKTSISHGRCIARFSTSIDEVKKGE